MHLKSVRHWTSPKIYNHRPARSIRLASIVQFTKIYIYVSTSILHHWETRTCQVTITCVNHWCDTQEVAEIFIVTELRGVWRNILWKNRRDLERSVGLRSRFEVDGSKWTRTTGVIAYWRGIAGTGCWSARDSTWSRSVLRPSPSRFPPRRERTRGETSYLSLVLFLLPLCFPLRPTRACAAIDSACSRRNTGLRRYFFLRNAARKSSCEHPLPEIR